MYNVIIVIIIINVDATLTYPVSEIIRASYLYCRLNLAIEFSISLYAYLYVLYFIFEEIR